MYGPQFVGASDRHLFVFHPGRVFAVAAAAYFSFTHECLYFDKKFEPYECLYFDKKFES
jgi:hypothetical protein